MSTDQPCMVVTGASSGLGQAIVRRLALRTPNLVLVARREEPLRRLADEIHERHGAKPMVCQCDISDDGEVARVARAVTRLHPCIDVLVNNAGIAIYKPTPSMPAEEMRRLFEVNMFGAFYIIRAFLPALGRSRAGYVLNIGSLFSRIALADNSVYSATKFALAGYTQGLRQEFRHTTIRVGLLNPGPMNTNLHATTAGIRVPAAFTLDVETMARHADRAIQRRSPGATHPYWLLMALRLRRWFGHS